MAHALFEYELESQGDFLLNLVNETPATTTHSVPRYIPPHKLMSQYATTLALHNPQTTNIPEAAGVSHSVKSSLNSLPTDTEPQPLMLPPSVGVVPQTEAPLASATNVSLFTNPSCITPLNNRTAALCGCVGDFFWELIPSLNLNFFRGTVPDTVDHCICSMQMYNTFLKLSGMVMNNVLSTRQMNSHFSTETTPLVCIKHIPGPVHGPTQGTLLGV